MIFHGFSHVSMDFPMDFPTEKPARTGLEDPDRFVELRATSTGCFFKALCRAVRRMAKAKAKGVATWSDARLSREAFCSWIMVPWKIWLVVDCNPSEKYENSSVGMIKFPTEWKNNSKPPTNQPVMAENTTNQLKSPRSVLKL